MKKVFKLLCGSIFVLLPLSIHAASPNTAEDEFHVAYEMPVFSPSLGTQSAGTHLNAPGDRYRYTYIIEDKYATDPSFILKRANLGVHIIDSDFNKETGDQKPEWGQILINNQPRYWIHFKEIKNYRKDDVSELTNLVEMKSDDEVGGVPPYIFNVTELIKDRKLILEVINLRSDGAIDSSADYGDFNVLRGGLHLYYIKK
ncbi:hypothetical protein ACM9HF_02035 [Colwellia sp. RE-S-Sl-9]